MKGCHSLLSPDRGRGSVTWVQLSTQILQVRPYCPSSLAVSLKPFQLPPWTASQQTTMGLKLSLMSSLVWCFPWVLLLPVPSSARHELIGSLPGFSTADLGCGMLAAVMEGSSWGALLIHDHGLTHFRSNGMVEGRGHNPGWSRSLSSALFCHLVRIRFRTSCSL